MTKSCILICSHLYYQGQADYLENCISSLLNQTVVSDIYISISFENLEYSNSFEKMKEKYLDNCFVNMIMSDQRKFQMEHLHLLVKYTDGYDLVFFADDDDTYEKNRVEDLTDSYMSAVRDAPFEVDGVWEYYGYEMIDDMLPEFWSYGIKPKILRKFFDKIERSNNLELLKCKFADIYLRRFLRLKKNGRFRFGYAAIFYDREDQMMYNYNHDNVDSICERTKNFVLELPLDDISKVFIRDQLLLQLIYDNYRDFLKIILNCGLTFEEGYEIVSYEECERIKTFVGETLY